MAKTTPKTIPLPRAAESFAQQSLRVAAYCRAADAENALEAQKSYYADMIAANPNWTLAGIFADIGTQCAKRPGFQELLHKCRQQEIDLILVRSVSRFSRNLAGFRESLQALRELGVTVVFETENISTADPDSDILYMTMSALAEVECQNIPRNSVHKPHIWLISKKTISAL